MGMTGGGGPLLQETLEPQDGMEVTVVFEVEVQGKMGVTGGRVDL